MKKLFLIFTTVFFLMPLFAQEESIDKPHYSADFVMQFEPGILINTESVLVSAPSPIVYPISVGFIWPDAATLAIQPTVSFFMMQHLYYDDRALPAEIENRTTTTLSFMLNIPAVY